MSNINACWLVKGFLVLVFPICANASLIPIDGGTKNKFLETQIPADRPSHAKDINPAALCFDGASDPIVRAFLVPNYICRKRADGSCDYKYYELHEDESTIEKIHLEIIRAYNTYRVDPRLIYYRILGESQGLAKVHAYNGDGGYGLFQLTGSLLKTGHHITNLNRIYNLKKNKNVSPRLLQVYYYIDVYIAAMAEAADSNSGCRPGAFSTYSQLEKLTYLGLGGCTGAYIWKEAEIAQTNKSYKLGATKVLSTLIDFSRPGFKPAKKTPVCGY